MNAYRPRGRRSIRGAISALSLAFLASNASFAKENDPAWIARGRQGMVASDHRLASKAGLHILRQGGNAVDAACAVSFALAVTRPESTGLGGGGFLMVRMANTGRTVVIDSRETAPAAATSDIYERAVAAGPTGPTPSRYGHLAVAIPGLLAGNARVLREFGTMKLADLLTPAVELATEGFDVDAHYVKACKEALAVFADHPELQKTCPYVYKVHLGGGKPPQVGDRLRRPALAKLLRAIAAGGPDVFYRGPIAEAIENEMRRHGGIVTRADLSDYRVAVRKPLVSTYRGYEIITVPPPSSGGVCVIESLNILELALPTTPNGDNDPRVRHFLVEAMKHAFADRARWLADPDFVEVPTGLLTSKRYARRLATSIDKDSVSAVASYGTVQLADDGGTSHFSIIDRWGNCVVSTETINTVFGSLAAVGDWGLILNNEMDDFAARPGRPNAFGLTQSERNAPQPGKRPLSSMSPTIVMRGQNPVLLLGGSGGPRIITSVLNVMVNVLDLDWPLAKAVENTRVHHQWMPNEVVFDRAPAAALVDALRSLGHTVAAYRKKGVVQAIQIQNGELIGASDPRKGGQPAGY